MVIIALTELVYLPPKKNLNRQKRNLLPKKCQSKSCHNLRFRQNLENSIEIVYFQENVALIKNMLVCCYFHLSKAGKSNTNAFKT